MQSHRINTSYEPFSDRPEYLELNRSFIRDLRLEDCRCVLDLACGTGNLAAEVLNREPSARIVGLDICRESLLIARHRIGGGQETPADEGGSAISLVEGSADVLPLADSSFDAVVMGNAIHNLPDLDRLLDEVHRVLRPGGVFAFNTSFYAGTFAPGTERFYLQWMKDALRWVQERNRAAKQHGEGGLKRSRGTRPRSTDRPWLSLEQYQEALERHGFKPLPANQRSVLMSSESFESVGAYAGLATVLLSGYPVEMACEALQETARSALAASGMEQVPRLWLELAAVKR